MMLLSYHLQPSTPMSHLAARITKNEILTELFNAPALLRMLSKFNAGGGQEDLKSELFAVLCEKPEEKIIELHTNNQLMFYATAIVQKMVFQTGGRFHRRYRNQTYEVHEQMMTERSDDSRQELEEQLKKLDAAIENDLHWVERSMLNIYNELGSLEKTKEKTKISERNVRYILGNAKSKLKTAITGKLMGNYIKANCELLIDVPQDVTPETINDILEETLEYMAARLQGQMIPSKNQTNGYIKEIKPLKVKSIL